MSNKRMDIELMRKFEKLFIQNKHNEYSNKIYYAILKADFKNGVVPIKLKKLIKKYSIEWAESFLSDFQEILKELDKESLNHIKKEIRRYADSDSFIYKNNEYKILAESIMIRMSERKVFKPLINPGAMASSWLVDKYKVKGLTLSERIWKNADEQSNKILNYITNNLNSGMSAKQMARNLMSIADGQNIEIPKWLKQQLKDASPEKIAKQTEKYIKTKLRKNLERITRTEIQRAWRINYVKSIQKLDFVIGVKWQLSGSHRKADICDHLATDNLYGLGPGVYPKDKIPFDGEPAHPHCFCLLISVCE